MNAAGSALAWCAVQVAFVGVAAIGAYWLVGRLHQAASGFAATTGLAIVFCLSAAAASPWPRWSFLEDRPVADDQSPRNRWSKVPLLGAVTRMFIGDEKAPLPGNATATMVGAKPQAVIQAGSQAEDAAPSLTRAVMLEMPGAFWLERRPRENPWRWTASLAVMFSAGLTWGAMRLLLAVQAVRIVRRESSTINDASLVSLLASLQEQLHSSRRIELRETDLLAAPATMGWRRPVILLPPDWRQWTQVERRAVLAHEIGHVERGDYLMWLAAQMALVLHFYHPAVHWLAGKIRLEQEFAADAIAAPVVGGPRPYLATLARLALRTTAPARPVAAPTFFTTRSMMLQRIERLRRLESDPGRAVRWSSKLVAASILITAALIASGFRSESAEAPLQNTNASARPGERAPG